MCGGGGGAGSNLSIALIILLKLNKKEVLRITYYQHPQSAQRPGAPWGSGASPSETEPSSVRPPRSCRLHSYRTWKRHQTTLQQNKQTYYNLAQISFKIVRDKHNHPFANKKITEFLVDMLKISSQEFYTCLIIFIICFFFHMSVSPCYTLNLLFG